MTLALAQVQLPCQPQSEPRHHTRSDPLPTQSGLTPNTKGGRARKGKKKKDVVEQCHGPRFDFCDDASSRFEKGGKPIPPALSWTSGMDVEVWVGLISLEIKEGHILPACYAVDIQTL